jgi:hypothetical protein
MNPSIADPVLNAKTDYSTILYQASVFNGSCLVYAPRYRQAHIAAFFMKDTMAAKKAFDEKQLGLFSSKSSIAIKQLQGQRDGFVALKAAGASSADALKMVEDADFAVSLSKAKTSAQVKKLIKDYQNERKEIEKTLRANDPQAFLKTQMDIIDQKLDLDERIARRAYERETQAAEDQIDINNKKKIIDEQKY